MANPVIELILYASTENVTVRKITYEGDVLFDDGEAGHIVVGPEGEYLFDLSVFVENAINMPENPKVTELGQPIPEYEIKPDDGLPDD